MNISSKPEIIGLAGTFASGKDTLANYLTQRYGYLHVSTSDMVRQEALRQRGSIERPVLHEVGTALRREQGAGVLAKLAIQLYKAKKAEGDEHTGVVVSGLRSLGEAKEILAAGGRLIFTDAPIQIRYQRMKNRLRDSEAQLTPEEFERQEAREFEPSGDGDGAFNMRGIRDMAAQDHGVIMNDNDLDSFLMRAEHMLGL